MTAAATRARTGRRSARTAGSLGALTNRFYLIRHADVENPNRVLYGHLPGFKLSAVGRAQAIDIGQRLRTASISRIVHSPLDRAAETASLIADQLTPRPELEVEPQLTEAEFSRYLQGVPYWQVPIRRPLWLIHKARRGLVAGDETIEAMGRRVLAVVRRQALDHPGATIALVSHADPLNAARILIEGRPHNEPEMHRSGIDKAGMLQLDMDGGTPTAWKYIPPPKIMPVGAAA